LLSIVPCTEPYIDSLALEAPRRKFLSVISRGGGGETRGEPFYHHPSQIFEFLHSGTISVQMSIMPYILVEAVSFSKTTVTSLKPKSNEANGKHYSAACSKSNSNLHARVFTFTLGQINSPVAFHLETGRGATNMKPVHLWFEGRYSQ